MLKKITKLLNHSFWDTLINFIKKFKSSKSYWSVSSLILIFTIREAIAWKYGSAIRTFFEEQAKDSDYATIWNIVGFIFDIGGSIELVLLGIFFFIGISVVKVKVPELKEELEEIKALIRQNGGDETLFLEKYFGEDYPRVLENPQTYLNLKSKLLDSSRNIEELLKEKDELLKKIQSQSLKSSIQNMVDKAFQELRYEDVRILLDEFIEVNQDIGDEVIKAHYQKALAYIEELKYHKAKIEFEEFIPIGIKDAEILDEYGSLYYKLGEYDNALMCHEKALNLNIENFGDNHPSVATNYNKIGMVWHNKKKYKKALKYYTKAFNIRVSVFGKYHADTAESYNNIGGVLGSQGEYEKAIKFHNNSLNIRLNILKNNHPDIAESYNNIGLIWKGKGEYDKAIKFYKKSLEILIYSLGNNHPYVASTYNNIGSALKSKEEYNEAIKFYMKSLNIGLITLGENHPQIATSYNNIGRVYDSKGEFEKAMSFYQKSLEIFIATVGESHPYVQILRTRKERVKEKF